MHKHAAPPKRRTPAKARTTKGATKGAANKSTAKRKTKKPSSSNSWKRRLLMFFFKIGLVVVAILLATGIYLDRIVQDRFEGQMWQLPSVLYGRVLTLQPSQNVTHQEVLRELEALKYLRVSQPRREGEYAASATRIELVRRSFLFAEGDEPAQHVMLSFSNGILTSIKSLGSGQTLTSVKLEPKLLGTMDSPGEEQRLFVSRDELPQNLIDTLLATEDRNFYSHEGVSPWAITRALIVNMQAGRTVQGGSTLTQQLAKNLFLSRERSLWRKVREAYMAVIIDLRYDKDRILEAYMNEVYLGQNGNDAIHGFGLGARFYFGRPLQELRTDQLALMVGMVKGPSYYNPWRYPDRAKERRNLVLHLMREQDFLTQAEYQSAVKQPLDVQKTPSINRRQPAYFQQVRREISLYVGNRYSTGQGLRIFTTLDPLSQQAAESAVAKIVPQLGSKLEAAAVIADRETGEIRAMVGGADPSFAGFNRAMDARRQIGSLVKPAVYMTALADPSHWELGSTIDDKAISLRGNQGSTWSPRNYDRKFRGEVPLYLSLAKSLNVPTVNVGMKVGLDNVKHSLIQLGVPPDQIQGRPSMLLGALNLTPFEVTQMFQAIGNSGKHAPLTTLRAVTTAEGQSLYDYRPRPVQTVSEQAAWLTTYAMKHAVVSGTARRLHGEFASIGLAAKTGTTDNNRDSWIAGIDGREVTTIWVGRDDNGSTGLTGSSGALKVYQAYLSSRQPVPLRLHWPDKMRTGNYQRNANGSLTYNCNGNVELPVWDRDGTLDGRCGDELGNFMQQFF
uniref:penicillin-binding protein 1B n=1 Tax=Thaumasiovibrio occultus TaxID=1891184 RepID=UPI000B34E2F9|nr:penicillin-binding protein 1B [Thaumasiovibrio occultus]